MRLIREGEMGWGGGGGGVWRWREREIIIYLSLHCHHQNDFCIKVGSDEIECHLNVSLIVRDKVTRQCPQTTTNEERLLWPVRLHQRLLLKQKTKTNKKLNCSLTSVQDGSALPQFFMWRNYVGDFRLVEFASARVPFTQRRKKQDTFNPSGTKPR